MNNFIDEVDKLHQELKQLLPFKEKDKRRLEEKLRLEFNFNTNHLEGNTLTYLDTKILLLKDIVPKEGKSHYSMRELEEMKAHDAAFSLIKEWATDYSRDLTEIDIKSLNKLILVKDFWKDAQTQDGLPSRKIIKVGEYKETPNSVRLQNGEVFHYADPIEVPSLMQDLLQWYYVEKNNLHPVILAAIFHHKYILIHPFDDGNGRIARLIINYIFIKNQLPPIVIKSRDKTNYLNALRIADTGDLQPFIDYISKQSIWSLQLSIKAANGEVIEDGDDWEKELTLLSKKENNISERRTEENTIQRIEDSILPLFRKVNKVGDEKILPLFVESDILLNVDKKGFNPFLFKNKRGLDNIDNDWIKAKEDQSLYFVKTFLNYTKNGHNTFNLKITTECVFKNFTYELNIDEKLLISKNIDEKLSNEDIEKIIVEFGKNALHQIKENTKNS